MCGCSIEIRNCVAVKLLCPLHKTGTASEHVGMFSTTFSPHIVLTMTLLENGTTRVTMVSGETLDFVEHGDLYKCGDYELCWRNAPVFFTVFNTPEFRVLCMPTAVAQVIVSTDLHPVLFRSMVAGRVALLMRTGSIKGFCTIRAFGGVLCLDNWSVNLASIEQEPTAITLKNTGMVVAPWSTIIPTHSWLIHKVRSVGYVGVVHALANINLSIRITIRGEHHSFAVRTDMFAPHTVVHVANDDVTNGDSLAPLVFTLNSGDKIRGAIIATNIYKFHVVLLDSSPVQYIAKPLIIPNNKTLLFY